MIYESLKFISEVSWTYLLLHRSQNKPYPKIQMRLLIRMGCEAVTCGSDRSLVSAYESEAEYLKAFY